LEQPLPIGQNPLEVNQSLLFKKAKAVVGNLGVTFRSLKIIVGKNWPICWLTLPSQRRGGYRKMKSKVIHYKYILEYS